MLRTLMWPYYFNVRNKLESLSLARLSSDALGDRLLALFSIIRLSSKALPGTNALAYQEHS
jgi:hypothetical protein